jgi:hypothetical protein
MQVQVARGQADALASSRALILQPNATIVSQHAQGLDGVSLAVKDCTIFGSGHKGWAQHTLLLQGPARCASLLGMVDGVTLLFG